MLKNWKERKKTENRKEDIRLRKIKAKGIKNTRGNPGHKHRTQKKKF